MNVQNIPLNSVTISVARDFWLYNEPRDLKLKRIESSLPFISEYLLLDENFTSIQVPYFNHPFFLTVENGIKEWNKRVLISELGYFRYKPAYQNLREIYLWDKEPENSLEAILAIGKLGNEKILIDIEKKMRRENFDSEQIITYILSLNSFDSNKSVQLMLDLVEELEFRSRIDDNDELHSPDLSKDITDNSANFYIRIILDNLKNKKTPLARITAQKIYNLFPNNKYLRHYSKWHKDLIEPEKPLIYLGFQKKSDLYGKDCYDVPF